jgi:hypothetical protein
MNNIPRQGELLYVRGSVTDSGEATPTPVVVGVSTTEGQEPPGP